MFVSFMLSMRIDFFMDSVDAHRTKYMRWLTRLFLCICFFGILELTAQLGYELRQPSLFQPLAWIPWPLPSSKKSANRTSELGNPSDIYRGEKRRWAVVGTSWITPGSLEQDSIWPSLLQARFRDSGVHVANFSAVNTSGIHILRYLALSGQRFEKLFFSLDGVPDDEIDEPNWRQFFPGSRAWLGAESRFPLSVLTFASIWQTTDFFKWLVRTKRMISQKAGFKSKAAFRGEALFLEACYIRKMREHGCAKAYGARRTAEPRLDPWAVWKIFLICQEEVDRECGVPPRYDEDPFPIEYRISKWQAAVREYYRAGSLVADKVYFVSHPMRGTKRDLPDGGVDSTSDFISILNLSGQKVVLSSRIDLERNFQKPATLETIAMEMTADTIDLHTQLMAPFEAREKLFIGTSHLSESGHSRVVDIIESRLRKDDPTLLLQNQ